MSVVVITGCSSGFGLETALAFARRGDTTYATMRDLSKPGGLVERAEAENLAVELACLDVTDEQSVTAAIAAIEESHGAIDVLVNNAGIDYTGPVETTDLSLARAVMETNFWGPVRTIQATLPAMRKKGAGTIINVSSVVSRLPGTPYGSWYSASKHALNAVTDSLHIELEGFGVRVVSIEPGFFATAIGRNARGRTVQRAATPDDYAEDEEWLAAFFEQGASGGGDPADVAHAVVRAATDPTVAVHSLVGDDAVALVAMARDVGSLEEWVPAAVAVASMVVGPRPTR
jgi:NAD(P)-dependent dehydrogenase (short-subunit alcohol dehydrogenase family)